VPHGDRLFSLGDIVDAENLSALIEDRETRREAAGEAVLGRLDTG
jgi:hypothetical protein